MDHIGIDLGSRHSHLVVLSCKGQEKKRQRVFTSELVGWLRRAPTARVVMEACTQSPAVSRAARAAGHQVVVVPGQLVRALGVGARGLKTDDRDAEVLVRASFRNQELPSVHARSELSCSRREVLAARHQLLEARKAIVLSVKSWLRGRLVVLKGRAQPATFSAAVRRRAAEHPDGLPLAVDTLLKTYDHLSDQIDRLDEELEGIAAQDETCQQLQTIPGVGPLTALAFAAQVDDPRRFPSANELSSYMALVPGESTTGGKIRRTATIKAGPRHLKSLLVQCAWVAWRTRPNEPMVLWARAISERKGKRVAIIALAHKMATIMWSMWKHGTSYDPTKAARARPSAPASIAA